MQLHLFLFRRNLPIFQHMEALDSVLGLGASRPNTTPDPLQFLPIERAVFPFLRLGICLTLCLLFQIGAVVSVVGEETATVNLHDFPGDAVQEIPVVGDHDNCATILLQLLFQQLYGFVVDVVGRLVQQQHIAGLDECRSDTGTTAFSAGERSDVP